MAKLLEFFLKKKKKQQQQRERNGRVLILELGEK